jgi:hypothetical protein
MGRAIRAFTPVHSPRSVRALTPVFAGYAVTPLWRAMAKPIELSAPGEVMGFMDSLH